MLDGSVVMGDEATTANRARAMIDEGYRAMVIGFDGSLLRRGIASLRAPGPMIAAKARCSGSHGLLRTDGFLASSVEDKHRAQEFQSASASCASQLPRCRRRASRSSRHNPRMCYSARIQADYRSFVRLFGPRLSIKEFFEIYWRRSQGERILIPRAMDEMFASPATDEERAIKELIGQHRARSAKALTETIFKQKTRLNEAQRKLQDKVTKKAQEDARIATDKIAAAEKALASQRGSQLSDEDFRIFPDWYAPVMVVEGGEKVVMPMRYHCLPAGKPRSFDRQFPGTFNARRDSLRSYWKGVFGVTHGVAIVDAFYENVPRHKVEGRELAEGEKVENVILEFRPDTGQPMHVACLWSRYRQAGLPDLLSWAAITDEPPPEVAAAGHDRCIIPLKPENVEAWLHPSPTDLDASYALLDDREVPYYEHREAA